MKILPTEFDGQAIRRVYDEDTETWWFSVIDVVQVLTDSNNARRYWSDLKRKLAQEAGSEQLYEKIVQLKLNSPDGKKTRNRLRHRPNSVASGAIRPQPQSRAHQALAGQGRL